MHRRNAYRLNDLTKFEFKRIPSRHASGGSPDPLTSSQLQPSNQNVLVRFIYYSSYFLLFAQPLSSALDSRLMKEIAYLKRRRHFVNVGGP